VRGEPTAFVLGEGNKVELRVLKTDRAIGVALNLASASNLQIHILTANRN
jgi:hypothetical protein